MPKRNHDMSEQYKPRKKVRPRIKLAAAPPIRSLTDLLEIGRSITFYKGINMIMLWRVTPYLEELNSLVGMESFKDSIFHQILYYMQGMHTRGNEEYLHTIMVGPPGTGKTTAAKILGKIYQSMGILSKDGPFRIAHRDDFIAGYLGQTALKTQKLLNSCLGGVLFIDEVYALAPRREDKDSFADEAMDILTSFLSEHKNDFCCIAAGYEDDINNRLFAKNAGLKRRFPWVHKIEPYTPLELSEIFMKMVQEINWDVSISKQQIADIIKANKELFKYAGGDVETFITKCKMAHSRRVFNLDKEHKFILTKQDLLEGIEIVKKNIKNEENDQPPPGMYL